EAWYATNVYKQRQPGYVAATVTLPLGDASAEQLRALADIARRFVKDTLRTTVEQNILFRWLSEADLPEFYRAIRAIGLGAADAATIVDVTACPGTDTCKLGIASSRGLARELRYRLGEKSFQDFVRRIGKKEIKDLLEDLTKIPAHEVGPSYYTDWGDPREFTLTDMGTGECAGEVVSQAEFALAASERELFEAQLLLDGGR